MVLTEAAVQPERTGTLPVVVVHIPPRPASLVFLARDITEAQEQAAAIMERAAAEAGVR